MGFGGQLNQVMQNEKTSGHINIQLMFLQIFFIDESRIV